MQEQLDAVQVRLQEAHAAKESSAEPSKEVMHTSLPLQPDYTSLISHISGLCALLLFTSELSNLLSIPGRMDSKYTLLHTALSEE